MDKTQVTEFLADLVGVQALAATYEEVERSKRTTFDKLFEELTPSTKDLIREGMKFRTVDAKGKKKGKSHDKGGQETSVDTFGSTSKGEAISSEDQPKVQQAMDAVVELTRKAIDRLTGLKRPEDKNKPKSEQRPVYDLSKQEDREKFQTLIEIEVFTPLVREGLLPENFVLDEFSEVQKLLNNTFAQYRGTLKESEEEESRKKTEKIAKLHAESGRFHAVKKLAFKTSEYKDYLKEEYGPSEDTARRLKIGKEAAKAVYKNYKAFKSIDKILPTEDGTMPKGVAKQDRFLHPEKYQSLLNDERTAELGDSKDPDDLRLQLAHQRQEDRLVKKLGKFGKALEPLGLSEKQMEDVAREIAHVMELKDEDPVYYTKSGIQLLVTVGKGSKSVIEKAIEACKLDDTKANLLQELAQKMAVEEGIAKAAAELVETIDAAIVAGVTKSLGAEAADAFDGLYSDEVDVDAVEEAAVSAANGGNLSTLVGLLADGITATFTKAAYEPIDPTFSLFVNAGTAAQDAFAKAASFLLNAEELRTKPDATLDPLGDVAFKAVAGVDARELQALLSDPQALRKLASKSAIPDEEAALDELERSDKELKEYERQLTLIDETGISLAEQRSIEVLIANLKRDKEVLEMVSALGKLLTGSAGGAVNIAAWATEQVTDVISGQVGSALKAAKLIMQLAINTKKAADRWALWYKFKTDLQRSKTAVSSMSSTIQGFFDNKKEQIAFHTIEDALIAVQVAAAILGAIPNEYAMAIGKTMGVVASAAQQSLKVSQMVYNEAKLSEAWAITKAAMDSPRDRALGLQALRLNPTLGMHAIAWAALEKVPADPIARMVLNSVGVDENTLAAGASQKKVRKYLTELLSEDRQLTDSSKITTSWAPETFTLSVRDWFVVTSRGQRDAVPKLRKGDENAVLLALRKTDEHDLAKIDKDARQGAINDDAMKLLEEETQALRDALNSYQPVSTDGAVHVEMSSIADEFLKLASEHRSKIEAYLQINRGLRNPVRALNILNDQLEIFEQLLGPKGQEQNPPPNITADEAEKFCDDAQLQIDELSQSPAFQDAEQVQLAIANLREYVQMTRFWILTERRSRKR